MLETSPATPPDHSDRSRQAAQVADASRTPEKRIDQLAQLEALTPSELVSIQRDEALRVEHVSKRFVKSEGMRLFRRKSDGRASKRIVRAVTRCLAGGEAQARSTACSAPTARASPR